MYTLFLFKENFQKFINLSANYLWMALSIQFCEPAYPNNLCQYMFRRLLVSMIIFAWWISVYNFCEYPPLSTFLFLASSILASFNFLSLNLKLRACLPAGFSSLAYGNLLVVDFSHLHDLVQIIHFASHAILFLVALYAFVALEPKLQFVNSNHQRVYLAELVAHSLMAILEPVYWLLAMQNIISLYSEEK